MKLPRSLRLQILALLGAFGVLLCVVLLLVAMNVREHDARREIEARLLASADATARSMEKLLELDQHDFGSALDALLIQPELKAAAYVGPDGSVEQATDRRWVGKRPSQLATAPPVGLLDDSDHGLATRVVRDDVRTQVWMVLGVREALNGEAVREATPGHLLLWADASGAVRDAVWVAGVLTTTTIVLPIVLMLTIAALWLRFRVADRIDRVLSMARGQVEGTLSGDPVALVGGDDEIGQLGREVLRLIGSTVQSRDLARQLLVDMNTANTALKEEQQRLRAVLDEAPVGIRHVDQKGRVLVNDRFCRMVGRDRETLEGLSFIDLVAPEFTEAVQSLRVAMRAGSADFSQMELQLVRADQARLWVRVSWRVARAADGGLGSALTVVEDIDLRRRDEQQLRLLAGCFEAAGDPVVVARLNGEVVAVNPAFTGKTGWTLEDMAQRTIQQVLFADMSDEAHARLLATLLEEGLWRGEVTSAQRNGAVLHTLVTISALRGAGGEPTHLICGITDLSRIREAEERVRRLAYFDTLTGLPNRQSLRERAQDVLRLAARRGEPVALMFLDLDNFKEVNDSLGHAAGDRLLCEVSARLLELCREADLLARLGGDEFVLLLPGCDAAGAGAFGQRVLQALRTPVRLAGHAIGMTASVGVGMFPSDGRDLDALMKNADTAMYRSKQAGRNTLCFYDRSMNEETLERLMLQSALRLAAQHGELRTHYQPKVDLLTGRVTGAEALIRWEHPQMGLLAPGRFMPAAEQSDLIVMLDEWVLGDVCRQLQEWRKQGLPALPVSVNVAAFHFRKASLVDDVVQTLQRHGIPGSQIELEITEATLLEAGEERLAMMERLREHGLTLAIDDFGTGYSSLAYLKHLPISTLKIDRSFVRDLEHDADDRVLVSTIVTLAHNLGLQVVAEGVENEAQRRQLVHSCCEQGQGWLYAKAMPADEFQVWWLAQEAKAAATGAAAWEGHIAP